MDAAKPKRPDMRRVLRLIWPPLLKRWLPRSLFGRSILIIVLPIALMQAAVTWAFFDAHWESVTSRLADSLAGDVADIVQTYEANPDAAHFAGLQQRAERFMDLSVALQAGKALPDRRRHAFFAGAVDQPLRRALSERLDRPFWFDTTRYPAFVDIRVQLPQGVLRVLAPRDRAVAAQAGAFVMWLAAATLLLTTVAVLFIRNQVRAIERLAAAAEAFGRGSDVPSFRPHGATEVRQAAAAFIDMKSRIQRYIDQRTALLASVSHDLRTPLTRLKLELALARPSQRIRAMTRDVAEMEHMIDEYLAFARGETGETAQTVQVRALIEEVCEGARRAGAEVEVLADPGLEASLRPNAVKRALANLVMNAAAFGGHLRVEGRIGPSGRLEITVDDNGPGIPADRYEEAFKPFQRLDEARNQNEKGVGLGLAIARDVARGHGGDVVLGESPLGGLRATVTLPG
jgi:two-component system, OmpR family, osmolarity sensor histidine kinase EnvZ